MGSIIAGSAIGTAQGARSAIALKVADAAVKEIEENNQFDERYLVEGVVPAGVQRAYSVNYAVAGEQVPVFGSALPAGAIANDGAMAEHHGPTYRKLLESPGNDGGLAAPSNLVISSRQ